MQINCDSHSFGEDSCRLCATSRQLSTFGCVTFTRNYAPTCLMRCRLIPFVRAKFTESQGRDGCGRRPLPAFDLKSSLGFRAILFFPLDLCSVVAAISFEIFIATARLYELNTFSRSRSIWKAKSRSRKHKTFVDWLYRKFAYISVGKPFCLRLARRPLRFLSRILDEFFVLPSSGSQTAFPAFDSARLT